ncbi:hypothetical protein B0H21DRAFT_692241 [Amylocystis lapponica]|nr:hypothetical protein B0H21DRAFT_692241 [Amylocystis lapponica]
MATTASATEAWNAYQALMAIPREPHSLPVPYAHLHRLARLLASTRPRTRTLFLRLLSVLSTIHATGGYVKLWQWNALVDCAGKGWRKTRQEDFKAALDVFEDLMAQRSPGARFSGGSPVRPVPEAAPTVHPDIVTYTTLLNIAGRTLNEATLRRATILLESSRLLPNRITHLALVRYFARKNQLQGVRATLFNLKDQGFEMGLDGLNACIWAYARSGRLDVASTVYRALRHNLVPEDEAGENAITASVKRLSRVDGLTIPLDIKPDNTTFYTLIQAFAYHGDLIQCLRVFMDMITLSDADVSGHDHASPRVPNITSPTLPAFRAIFLGFARHGMPPAHLKNAGPLTLRLTSSAWTYDNLHILYQSFLALPHDVRPSDRTIYWVIKAFATTSGNDIRKLRRIWEQLETRFGGGWGGRLERFRHAIYGSPEK